MGRRFWKLAFVLLLVAPLGACGNFVRSEKPLFTAADEVGAVPLRPGIWGGHDATCAFDDRKPVDEWPNCAAGFVVGREGLKSPQLELTVDRVAAGDPMIVQFGQEDGSGYTYAAVEVLDRDKRGRATVILAWSVLCGPEGVTGGAPETALAEPAEDVGPPPPTPAPPEPVAAPRKLFPGLVEEGQNCLAADPATVRNAARESKTVGGPFEIRWLRTGRR